MNPSYSEAIARKEKSAARKQRKLEKRINASELAVLGGIPGPQVDQGSIIDGPCAPRKVKSLKSKPRRKKSLFVRLRNQLDKECQSYAVKRDEAKGCRIKKAAQCTGKSEVGYHLLPRGKWGVRWDLDFGGIGNIVGACSACNAGERWHRIDYAEAHRNLFGADFYEALWAESKKPYHYTSLDLQRILDDVRNRRKSLDSGNHKC